jgi:hypothetical protein
VRSNTLTYRTRSPLTLTVQLSHPGERCFASWKTGDRQDDHLHIHGSKVIVLSVTCFVASILRCWFCPDHELMRILQGSGKSLAQFGDGFSTWSMTMVSMGAFAGVSLSPIPRTEVRIEETMSSRVT